GGERLFWIGLGSIEKRKLSSLRRSDSVSQWLSKSNGFAFEPKISEWGVWLVLAERYRAAMGNPHPSSRPIQHLHFAHFVHRQL
ncbi:hypothetical protein M9458_041863, partial [Cirrhinus mrigala]